MDCVFVFDDGIVWVLFGFFGVVFEYCDVFNDGVVFGGVEFEDFVGFVFVGVGDYDDLVVVFDVKFCSYV